MKPSLNKLLVASMVCCFLFACKKNEVKTYMKTGVAPTVNLSPSTVILTAATGSDSLETISWTKSDYGFSSAVNYTLQVAKAGTNFASPKEYNVGPNTQLKFTGADLNQLALLRGLPPGSAGQLDIRIKSALSDSIANYSSKATLTVTPYLVIINYPSLWVPGDYQGWDPASAAKISSKQGNGVYEGYVNIPGGTLQFKLTSDPDWNHTNYGWASSTVTGNNVSGTFNTTGGNLFVPTAGYYLLKANTNSSTWSATKITSWSLIGDFNGWAADADMTYDPATKKWTATVNFPSSTGFKFRANHDWGINFGDTGADLILDYDGDNISGTAGTHTITLDLSVPGNYTYKIQ
jgi:hypothetical protein